MQNGVLDLNDLHDPDKVNLASGKVSFLTPVQYANSIFRKSIFSDRHVPKKRCPKKPKMPIKETIFHSACQN